MIQNNQKPFHIASKNTGTKLFIRDLFLRWFSEEQLLRPDGHGSAYDIFNDYFERLGLRLYFVNYDSKPYWHPKEDSFPDQEYMFPTGEYLIVDGFFRRNDHLMKGFDTMRYGCFVIKAIKIDSDDYSTAEIRLMGNRNYDEAVYAYSDEVKEFEKLNGIRACGLEPVNESDNEELKAAYLDVNNQFYAIELNIAIKAHTAICINGEGNQKHTIKNRIKKWLKDNYPNIQEETLNRLCTVANPKTALPQKK